jgi:hypothetical protein
VPEASPRWSILLPTHRAAPTIAQSIDSILGQTDADLELLVVGDGVDDETRAIMRRFADVRVVFTDLPKGRGFGYGPRAEVMRGARGRFIAFASDDDLWAPDHLERMAVLLGAGATIAHSRSFWCVPDGRLVPVPFDAADPANRERFARLNFVPANCWAVTAEAFAAAGGWPTEVANSADWVLWNAIMALPDSVTASTSRTTGLHFRARRRDHDHPSVEAVGRIISSQGGWPDDCRVEIPEGVTAQDAVVAASASDQQAWWDRVAAAADRVIDRLALAAVDELSLLESRIESLEADVVAFQASTSWRVTAPLRKLRRRAAR